MHFVFSIWNIESVFSREMASDQVKEAIAEVKEHNNSVEARPKMNPEESSWFHVFLFFSAFFFHQKTSNFMMSELGYD